MQTKAIAVDYVTMEGTCYSGTLVIRENILLSLICRIMLKMALKYLYMLQDLLFAFRIYVMLNYAGLNKPPYRNCQVDYWPDSMSIIYAVCIGFPNQRFLCSHGKTK